MFRKLGLRLAPSTWPTQNPTHLRMKEKKNIQTRIFENLSCKKHKTMDSARKIIGISSNEYTY